MPQFDYTTYTSQIFWFLICFSLLYFSVAYLIIPRIKLILDSRKKLIDENFHKLKLANNQIMNLNSKTSEVILNSNQAYQSKIETTLLEIQNNREIVISNLKKTIDELNKNSQLEISNFISNSNESSQRAIDNIANFIRTKLIN